MTMKKADESFKLGDRVRILHSDWRGRIVELRGPLGPGGIQIYRIRVVQKPKPPKPLFVEVRGDQLVVLPPKSGSLHQS